MKTKKKIVKIWCCFNRLLKYSICLIIKMKKQMFMVTTDKENNAKC